jgi:hypothetical protein
MRGFLLGGFALMLPALSACEQSFCVEEHPQAIEEVWQTEDQSFWGQIRQVGLDSRRKRNWASKAS